MKKIIFLFSVLVVALYTRQGNVFIWNDYYIQKDFFSLGDQICTSRRESNYCIPASEIKLLEKNPSNTVIEIKDIDRGIKVKGGMS